MPGAVLARHLPAGVLDENEDMLLHRVNNVTVGVHYGSRERVDFAIGTESLQAASALVAHIGGRSSLLQVADTLRTRSTHVSVEQNEVRGSMRVADKEFDTWLATVYARFPDDRGSGGENVARVGSAR